MRYTAYVGSISFDFSVGSWDLISRILVIILMPSWVIYMKEPSFENNCSISLILVKLIKKNGSSFHLTVRQMFPTSMLSDWPN